MHVFLYFDTISPFLVDMFSFNLLFSAIFVVNKMTITT